MTPEARSIAAILRAGKRSWVAHAWYLERSFPDRWRRREHNDQAEEFLYGSIRVPRVPKEGRDAFTDAEVAVILRVARSPESVSFARDYVLVTVALGHGPRLNEIRELTLDDVDFHQGLITIRGETSKSGRDRRVPLDSVAAAALDAYIQDWRPPSTSRVLFLTEAGRAFTYNGFLHVFTRLANVGVRKFMAHRCRNTWATNAHRQGYSVFDIQDMGGWRTLEMARRYASCGGHRVSLGIPGICGD